MSRLRIALLVAALLGVAAIALARVGGGQSYSGSSRSSGGSSYSGSSRSYGGGGSSYSGGGSSYGGGGGGSIGACGCLVVVVIFLIILAIAWMKSEREAGAALLELIRSGGVDGSGSGGGKSVESLRRYDPTFSRIVFDDFCSSLYARVQQARGTGDLARYAPYVSAAARQSLLARNPKGLTEVTGIVVGAMEVGALAGVNTPIVSVPITYEANLTEVSGSRSATWYLRETWLLERKRDLQSPPPAKARAEHCPRCGAALDTRTDGSCQYCGVTIDDGSFQWFVRSIAVISREPRGPLLTSDVPEEGTTLPTVRQPSLDREWAAFAQAHPSFRWDAFLVRVQEIAVGLQTAWGARQWESIRPLETESLFQTHRYWIDAYQRQQLRNVVEDYTITGIELAKVEADVFYDAITVRLAASGRDSTVDEQGKVVAGSRDRLRVWSEYWTLIRTRGTEADPSQSVSCPNCGAMVNVGTTGVCPHCGGKLAGGDFGWVLSRIEQDEAYQG